MKNTGNMLVLIGSLGMAASLFNMISKQEVTSNLSGFICGACLVWGYFELQKEK